MRYYYTKLFDYVNADASKIVSIEPCQVISSATGYYKLVSKGKVTFE